MNCLRSVPAAAGRFLELNDVYWVLRSTNMFFKVARLDFFWGGGHLPSLSINYAAMGKDMEKKVSTTVLYKDENFL